MARKRGKRSREYGPALALAGGGRGHQGWIRTMEKAPVPAPAHPGSGTGTDGSPSREVEIFVVCVVVVVVVADAIRSTEGGRGDRSLQRRRRPG